MKTAAALLIVGAFLLAGPQRPTPAVRHLAKPVERRLAGYEEASCVRVSASIDVCKVLKTDDGMTIELRITGKPVSTWQSTSMVYRDMFDVRVGDVGRSFY